MLVRAAGVQWLAIHVLYLQTPAAAGFERFELLFEDNRALVAVAVDEQHVALRLLGQHSLEHAHERRDARAGPDEH